MDDLDEMLGRLAHAPVHSRLAATEAIVLVRTEGAATSTGIDGRGVILAAAGAMLMGLAGAAVPAATADAQPSLSLGGIDALAPSTLLGGER